MKALIPFLIILTHLTAFSTKLIVIDTDYKPIENAIVKLNDKEIGKTNNLGEFRFNVSDADSSFQVDHKNFYSKNFSLLASSNGKYVVKLKKKENFVKADLTQYESFKTALEFFEIQGDKSNSYTIPIRPDEDLEIFKKNNEYLWMDKDSIIKLKNKERSEKFGSDVSSFGMGATPIGLRPSRVESSSSVPTKEASPLKPTNSVSEISALTTPVKQSKEGFMVRNSKADASLKAIEKTVSSSSSAFSNDRAGMLTAGIINDFSKWELWSDYVQTELVLYQKSWGINPQKRYTVLASNEDNYPLIGAKVYLLNENKEAVWEAVTDNLGRAELWSEIFGKSNDAYYSIKIEYQDETKEIENIFLSEEDVNKIQLDVNCNEPNVVDIAFVIDATGSMGDEINYLKAELGDIMARTKSSLPNLEINLSSAFYRDSTDDYVARYIGMTDHISKNLDFISINNARGGGDYPEAVAAGLTVAIENTKWSENSIAKLLFLVLDAPPHHENKQKIKELTRKAAKMGIRLIPIACSGTNKETEFITRSMALATGGRYIFLTDDSGIGNSHIKPTTDEYEVLSLNKAIYNTIIDYSKTNECNLQSDKLDNNITYNPDFVDDFFVNSDVTDPTYDFESWKIYPNPSKGRFTIETDGVLGNIIIADMRGSIIQKIDGDNANSIFVTLQDYPNGEYLVMQELPNGKYISSKIIILK